MDLFHIVVLDIHSLNRWLILFWGAYVWLLSLRGWVRQEDWSSQMQRRSQVWIMLLDIQLLLGLLLYLVSSPITTQGLERASDNPANRFFLIEHGVLMVVAILLAHGFSMGIKKARDQAPWKRAVLGYGLVLLMILVAIPWPFMPGYGRPWLF